MKIPTINLRHQIQMLCWGFLFMGIIGYWSFQHLLILNSYSYLGVSNLTIVCLLIIATLLPYSLARRFRLANEWYARAFCPSMLRLSVIANQHIGAATIITAALALTVCIVLAVKQPPLRCHPVNSNLTILIVVSIISLCITDTDDHRLIGLQPQGHSPQSHPSAGQPPVQLPCPSEQQLYRNLVSTKTLRSRHP